MLQGEDDQLNSLSDPLRLNPILTHVSKVTTGNKNKNTKKGVPETINTYI